MNAFSRTAVADSQEQQPATSKHLSLRQLVKGNGGQVQFAHQYNS
jgi:hypothetical protein